MKKAFVYCNDKSNKFWWIDDSGSDIMVNYGKSGTTGRYEIKEFNSEEECRKFAEKLISQKLKKGYKQDDSFDFINHFYFDDEEFGLHPKTSHPKFVKHFTDDFYYDCSNEEASFGSDEGSDALWMLTEHLRKKRKLNSADFPRFIIEQEWDMKYIPVDSLNEDVVKNLTESDEMNMIQSDMITTSVAFGQIKITGKIDEVLKQNAINSMKRIIVTAKILNWGDNSEILNTMITDLTSFK